MNSQESKRAWSSCPACCRSRHGETGSRGTWPFVYNVHNMCGLQAKWHTPWCITYRLEAGTGKWVITHTVSVQPSQLELHITQLHGLQDLIHHWWRHIARPRVTVRWLPTLTASPECWLSCSHQCRQRTRACTTVTEHLAPCDGGVQVTYLAAAHISACRKMML